MAEQRLIDANALHEDWLENGENEYIYDTNSFLASLDDAPSIDPETLPVVQQLRAELADAKAKLEMAVHDIYSGDAGDCDTCMHGCDCADVCDAIEGCEYKWRGDAK